MQQTKIAVSILAILLTTGLGAAQQAELDVGPGGVTPDSALYGLETAWDNAGMAVGLKKAGTVAQERAAEAKAMAEKNNTEGMQRATEEMNSVAKRATADDTEGLQKAASVIQGVMERAPAEAQQGLQTALDNINKARERADGAPDNTPSDQAQDNEGANASERIAEARQLMEQGRQDLRDGNEALDNNNSEAARQEFGQAVQRFNEAINLIDELDTAEADDLLTRLRDARDTARNARESAQQQDSQARGGQGGSQ